MPTLNWKTTEVFKRILEVLGPGGYEVRQLDIKKCDEDGDRLFGISDYKRKRITLFKHTGYLDAIDTVLHELLHAIYPDATEDEIEKLTKEIAGELWTSD